MKSQSYAPSVPFRDPLLGTLEAVPAFCMEILDGVPFQGCCLVAQEMLACVWNSSYSICAAVALVNQACLFLVIDHSTLCC